MPRMGDMWYEALRKLNNGEQLSNEELEAIRFAGNNTQATNDLVGGWQTGIVNPDFATDAVANEQIGFELNLASAQEIANAAAYEMIAWDTDNYQDANFYNLASDATSIYIPMTGWYLSIVTCIWESNATGTRIFRNYTDTVQQADLFAQCSGADAHYHFDARIKKWTKGTQLQIGVYQSSGGALDLNAAQWSMKKILSPKSRS